MGRRSRLTRKLIVIGGTIVVAAIMAGLAMASSRGPRASGYGYGSGARPTPCAYDSSGVNCPATPSYEWSGTVYDRHVFDLARCDGKSVADAMSAAKLAGATVDLLRRANNNSAFVEVPANSPGIAPPTNPETTDAAGHYKWSISAGNYEVAVSKTGYGTNRTSEQKVPPARPGQDVGLFKNGDPTTVNCPTPPATASTGATTGNVGGASAGNGTPVVCKVPNLVNKRKTLIRDSLSKSHCALGKLIKRYSSTSSGLVTKVSPAAGSLLRAGYKVNVVVSLGPKPKKNAKKH